MVNRMSLSFKSSDCIIYFIDQLETVIRNKIHRSTRDMIELLRLQIIAMVHLNSSAIFQRENHSAADGCRSVVAFLTSN